MKKEKKKNFLFFYLGLKGSALEDLLLEATLKLIDLCFDRLFLFLLTEDAQERLDLSE